MLENINKSQIDNIFLNESKADEIININKNFQADNGVTIRDGVGNVINSGKNYSLIKYQENQKMNMTMYQTKFRNTFNVDVDHLK